MQKTVKKWVEITLTNADMAEKAKELAKESKHLANLTAKKKRVNDVFKNKMDATSNQIIHLTDVIDKGFEEKEIECVETRDFNRKIKFYFDKDGVLVGQEKFTEYDMQTQIDDYLDQVFSPPSDAEIEQMLAEEAARAKRKREMEEQQEQEYQDLANLADKTSEQLDHLDDTDAHHGNLKADDLEPDEEQSDDTGF
jgi:hypothetical protein